ncbi:MAG: transcriptional regulator [Desulfobacteraceae bacterium]|nr:transcriptional regulator [Desulfobacteraceae bacterium]MCF8094151.1 transcriptional regulator [Desulfobacteraceae bacterium]
MATIRQRIIEILEYDEHDARQISQLLSISEKDVYDHLPHIAKSLSKQGKKLKTIPASCIACGYVFKNRDRVTRPGKCPVCKSERIENPRFSIK